jgi:hypothetical protein
MSTDTKTPDEIVILEVVAETSLDLFAGDRPRLEIEKMEKEVRSIYLDPTIKRDHAAIGALARKVSGFKTAYDKKGDALTRPVKESLTVLMAQRKMIRDRSDALRDEVLAPRVEHDKKIADKVAARNEAFELMVHGHMKAAPYGTPTEEQWKTLIAKIEAVELTEEFFGSRLDEACTSHKEALERCAALLAQCIEAEKVAEAGRIAIKEKEDAEAAARHKAREDAKVDPAKVTPPAESPKPNVDSPVEPKPLCNQDAIAAKARQDVKLSILERFEALGADTESAVKIVKAIDAGLIDNVSINY